MTVIGMRSQSDGPRVDGVEPRRRSGTRRVSALVLFSCLASFVLAVSGTAFAAPATIDGQFAAIGPIGQTDSIDLTVVGRGGVPATGVGAVALNVTATNPTNSSFLTVWPTGAPRPLASNLNYGIGQTVPNMVIVPVGANGQISIFNNTGGVDVVVDVLGWFPTGSSYTGLTPARLMDTRPSSPTIDGQFAALGPIGQTSSTNLTVVGRGAVPPTGVGAVALNVTATNPTAGSFLTVWPTGADRPLASNLNYGIGQTVPNMVIVPVAANGQISIYNNTGSVDVIVDVLGWFPTVNSYTGLTPARLMDTRPSSPTIDGQFAALGPIGQISSTNLTVVGRGGVPPTGVGAVALNVTATNPTRSSFLTVWPTGADRPLASNLNYGIGQTVPNMVIVPVGANGQISIYNNTGTVDVIVDVLGWFPTGASYTGLTPARQMDTRVPDPLPAAAIGPIRNLLVVRPTLHQMGGADRIAVWVCDVPAASTDFDYSDPSSLPRIALEPQGVARWAQRTVGSYYDTESAGRYEPTFIAMGHIPLSTTDGPSNCLNKARALSGRPFTNVLVTDTSQVRNGFASPGLIYDRDAFNLNLFDQPPSVTSRGAWVGGGSTSLEVLPSPMAVTHEIGHTLHWPHSFSGLSGTEYDNPTDVMSAAPVAGWCSKPVPNGTITWPCIAPHTLAFNRFAAGWIDDTQVQLQTSGTSTVTLDAPAGPGPQIVVAPDSANPHVMLTLEARPKIGNDQAFDVEGVAAYIVDQRPFACPTSVFDNGGPCISADRRQRQAISSTPFGFDHILQVGTTTSIDGLTITVTAHVGNTFTVQTSGTFVAPPTGA